MARPRKDVAAAAGPTDKRILEAAVSLFSQRGFDGVSVREIARAAGLNEASLYNHFAGKAALLEAVLDRLVASLIAPGFAEEQLPETGERPLAELVLAGAARFFRAADPEALKTWRLLMMEQYRNEKARDFIRERVLEGPRAHFARILEGLRRRGRLREGVDPAAAAALFSALFFEFSFAANLAAAWSQPDPAAWQRLRGAVELLAAALER